MAVNPVEVADKPTSTTRIWTPLTQRNFRLLWVGQGVSLLGDQFYFIALAWLALGPVLAGLVVAGASRSIGIGGATAFGIMSAGFGAGALLGMAGAGSMGTPRHRGLRGIAVITVFTAGTALLPTASSIAIAVILIAAMGAGSGFINVLFVPWLQMRPAPAMLGRIMSLVMFASVGLAPIAYAVSGWVASFGLTWLFLGGGALLFATALYTALSPARTID